MVATPGDPQVLVGSLRDQFLDPCFYYLNDIPSSVDCLILLFADNAKIYQLIRCEADYLQLQHDSTILYRCSKMWLLNFIINKCHLLYLGPTHCYGEYYINDNLTY